MAMWNYIDKKETNMKKIILSISLLLAAVYYTSAQQDALYSQYMFNKLLINPGYTGQPEAISTTAAFRRQWVGFDGSPTNFSINSHMPFKGDQVNLGLIISSDNVGVTQTTGIFGTYAYRLNLDIGQLGLGVDAGFNLHRRKWGEVDPINPNDDVFLRDTKTLFLPNAGVGFYLENDVYYAGLSIPRLLANKIDYTKNDVSTSRLSRHYYLMGGYNYEINRDIVLQPSAMIRMVAGAPIEVDITAGALFNESIWIGTTFRTGDAIVLLLNYRLDDKIFIGYSADFTYSQLSRYSSGTHEITLRYNYAKAKSFRSKY